MATLARAKSACKAQPGATFDIKWGKDQVYSIGGKMFAVMCDVPKDAPSISFKVEDGRFLELTDREGFIPAPYMARHKWVLVRDLKKVSDAELKQLITRSYELVAARLPKKKRLSVAAAG
jgi:predicted DNA-binding protein (MmcQ/YjbR family)